MYKLFESSFNKCYIEFPLLTTKKSKLLFLDKVLAPFLDEHVSIVGEINGLDFSVEKLSKRVDSLNTIRSSIEDGYMTLIYSTTNVKDFPIILSNFDRFSEGHYIIYIFSQCSYNSNELPASLIDCELDGFMVKFSVHSDATLFEFEFKNKSTYAKFISLVR